MLPSRLLDSMLDDMNIESGMECDIYEKKGIYHIEADIPGFKKEDIKVELNKGNLTITAEKKNDEVENDKKYLRRERHFYGKFQRSFYLGEVDEEKISASFKEGTLLITIPKKAEENNKRLIEIK